MIDDPHGSLQDVIPEIKAAKVQVGYVHDPQSSHFPGKQWRADP